MRRTALVLLTASLGCDGSLDNSAPGAVTPPTVTEDPGTTEDPEGSEVHETPGWDSDNPPYLVSRFAPTRGLPGTRIQILTAFNPSGCAAAGECKVMIGDSEALIENDQWMLEVVAPRFVRTGELCVTWRERTECSEIFEVLDSPLVYTVYPSQVTAGAESTTLTVTGDGFTDETTVFFNWQQLETHVTAHHTLTVQVPAELLASPGTASLQIYVPNVNRCGVRSEPVDFLIAP